MINYSEGIFTRTYSQDGKEFYATFHPEVITEKDEYATTGRFLVVLLQPVHGLQCFFLNKADETNTWKPEENSAAIVEEDLVEWCSHQIETQLNKNSEA